MRILLVTNSTERCGVGQWGRRMLAAARKAGWDIVPWFADYPIYLPEDLGTWDLVFFNWHPGTIGHILPEHLYHPASTRLAGFFHEITPERIRNGEVPELWKVMDLRFSAEGGEGAIGFPPPGPEVAAQPTPILLSWGLVRDADAQHPWREILRIGNSGIRADGLDWIAPVAARRGWELDLSRKDQWLSDEEEVERLARCHLNVAHYHSGYLGQSAAVMTMVASGRPLLINSNQLLRWVGRWAEVQKDFLEYDIPPQVYLDDDFERGVDTILNDIRAGRERRPGWLAQAWAWSERIKVLGTVLGTLR